MEHEAVTRGQEKTVHAVCPPVRPHTERLLLEGEVDCAWVCALRHFP